MWHLQDLRDATGGGADCAADGQVDTVAAKIVDGRRFGSAGALDAGSRSALDDVFLDATGRTRGRVEGDVQEVTA